MLRIFEMKKKDFYVFRISYGMSGIVMKKKHLQEFADHLRNNIVK